MRLNSKALEVFRKLIYNMLANIISLAVSVTIVLVAPKILDVAEYGYFQLYLFYSVYVGCMHLGCSDGIYLRYGGLTYGKLDKNKCYSQFYMVMFLQVMIVAFVFAIVGHYIEDPERYFVLMMVAVNMFFTNATSVLVFILQATNRIAESAKIIIVSRLGYIVFFIVILLALANYKLMIVADLIGKLMAFAYAVVITKDIVLLNPRPKFFDWSEWWLNVTVGSRLMLANIAGMLVIGIVRFGAELVWDITAFGKLSLALSLSTFFAVFINAASVVFFPLVRNTNTEWIKEMYLNSRNILMAAMLTILMMYYPLQLVLGYWLPDYRASVFYLGVLLPISIYECRTSLLVNTYLKAAYAERLILITNLCALLLSIAITMLGVYIKNFNMLVVGILIAVFFRAIVAEYFLLRLIGLEVHKDNLLELTLVSLFVGANMLYQPYHSASIYFIGLTVYMWIKRRQLLGSIEYVRGKTLNR